MLENLNDADSASTTIVPQHTEMIAAHGDGTHHNHLPLHTAAHTGSSVKARIPCSIATESHHEAEPNIYIYISDREVWVGGVLVRTTKSERSAL